VIVIKAVTNPNHT
jgi:hypothetical protein